MTPDADIDGLVRRLRECLIPGDMAMGVPTLPVHHPLMTEAAALIEALRKERDDLLTRAQTQHSRILTSNHQYLARASAAEQKLAEIEAETAQAFDTEQMIGIGNQMELKIAKVHRIAALARSTSTNGG